MSCASFSTDQFVATFISVLSTGKLRAFQITSQNGQKRSSAIHTSLIITHTFGCSCPLTCGPHPLHYKLRQWSSSSGTPWKAACFQSLVVALTAVKLLVLEPRFQRLYAITPHRHQTQRFRKVIWRLLCWEVASEVRTYIANFFFFLVDSEMKALRLIHIGEHVQRN